MTNTFWNGTSDDWTNAADWTPGLPNPKRDAVINANGVYTVTVSSADKAHSLTIDDAGATLSENSGGSLTLAGGLTLDAGAAILNGVNNFHGNTRLIGGTLELGNAAALGGSNLAIDGGALVGTANIAFSNQVTASGTFTLAAGHGDTFKFDSQTVLNMNSGGVIEFGQSGDDGVFVWDPATLGLADGGTGFSVDVNAGTLRDLNGSLSEVLNAATSVSVASGAKLDIHGNAETIGNLNGAGIITSSTNGGALTIDGGTFSGSITGDLTLTVANSLTLIGTCTYTGDTTIDTSATLSLQPASTNVFNGTISGGGAIAQDAGTSTLNGANTYSGGTALNGGILKIGNATALGTGELVTTAGELMGTANEALSNQLTINGRTTFAAASGTTMTLNTAAAWTLGTNVDIVFGSSKSDGVVVWDSPTGSNFVPSLHGITVADGTLQAGDSNFQTLLTAANYAVRGYQHLIYGFTNIEQGAALDVAGFASTVYYLKGNGTIENSGASTTVTMASGNFNGDFSGPITLDVEGFVKLGGEAGNVAALDIGSFAQLKLESASSTAIDLSSGANATLIFDDPSQFTGSVAGFGASDRMMLPTLGATGLSVSYSGDTTGGVLTLTSSIGSATIAMVGDYTHGTFSFLSYRQGRVVSNSVYFHPNPAASNTPHLADAFNFAGAPTSHIAPEAGVTHLHAGHAANEIAFAHDVTDALHTHGLVFDHFAHGLFIHHAIPEALL